MRRALAATLLMLTGGALLRLVLSQQHLRYVKESMSIPLLVSGAVLVLLGFAGWWLATSRPAAAVAAREDHGHVHLPAVAWLLLLPVLAIYLVPPPALGSDAVLRESSRVAAPASVLFPPLPPGDPVDLTPRDAVERVLFDPTGSGILGREVRVSGFAVPLDDPDAGDGWYVARIGLACCAADGVAYRIYVEGVAAPEADQWLTVTGTLSEPGGPTEGQPIPRMAATAVGPFTEPVNPYE